MIAVINDTSLKCEKTPHQGICNTENGVSARILHFRLIYVNLQLVRFNLARYEDGATAAKTPGTGTL
jgi:hypothetical protein